MARIPPRHDKRGEKSRKVVRNAQIGRQCPRIAEGLVAGIPIPQIQIVVRHTANPRPTGHPQAAKVELQGRFPAKALVAHRLPRIDRGPRRTARFDLPGSFECHGELHIGAQRKLGVATCAVRVAVFRPGPCKAAQATGQHHIHAMPGIVERDIEARSHDQRRVTARVGFIEDIAIVSPNGRDPGLELERAHMQGRRLEPGLDTVAGNPGTVQRRCAIKRPSRPQALRMQPGRHRDAPHRKARASDPPAPAPRDGGANHCRCTGAACSLDPFATGGTCRHGHRPFGFNLRRMSLRYRTYSRSARRS